MVPVGVLLMVLAVVFGVGFLVSPGESADIQFYGLMLKDLPARNLVVLGFVAGLIATLGAGSVRWGTVRWHRQRLSRKQRAVTEQSGNSFAETTESALAENGVEEPTTKQAATVPLEKTATGDDPTVDSGQNADLDKP